MKFLWAHKGIVIFIFLSVGFVLLVSKYAPDPRLTYDSHGFIESSESVDVYFNGKNADGHTYLFKPPVISLYLHFFQDKILAAKWLNVLCFVFSLWLCYFIGREFKFEPMFLSLFIASVGASYPWLQNHFFVWSEPLFGTLLLWLVWLMLRDSSWVWISVMCVLLFLTRKPGLFVSVAIVLEYFSRRDYSKAIRIGLVLGTIFILWESLPLFYSKESTSQRLLEAHAGYSRWHLLDAITAWFVPRNVALIVRVVVVGSFSTLLFFFRRQLRELVLPKGFSAVILMTLTYVLIFLVFLGVTEYEDAERLLSVVIPLTMLSIVAAVRSIYMQTRYGKYFLLGFLLWMTYPIGRTLQHLL